MSGAFAQYRTDRHAQVIGAAMTIIDEAYARRARMSKICGPR